MVDAFVSTGSGATLNAKHVTDTKSGHEIHKQQPQLVMKSIREIVDAVREGSRPPPR